VWGHQNFRYIAKYLIIMSKSQRDVQRDKVAWEHVELPCSTVDWRVDFRHAPARRYEHVWFCMRIRSFLPADATQVRLRRSGGRACGKVDCERVQDRPLLLTHQFQAQSKRCSRCVAANYWAHRLRLRQQSDASS
jgi:hypothetical protein